MSSEISCVSSTVKSYYVILFEFDLHISYDKVMNKLSGDTSPPIVESAMFDILYTNAEIVIGELGCTSHNIIQ